MIMTVNLISSKFSKVYNDDLDVGGSTTRLTSLEGCPEKVMGSFNCAHNNLTSFEHFPKYIDGRCYIHNNKFTSFKDIDKYIEHIGKTLYTIGNEITSGYSDLFGIDGLQHVQIVNMEIQEIVNRYLPTKDIINFQDEMIKAGFESYL